jgi:type IV secretion system protein VirB3
MADFDDEDTVVETMVHRSLTRPDLLIGCERAPVVFLGAVAFAFAMILQKPLTMVAAVVIVALGIPMLRHFAKRDPQMYRVYTRHFMYQDEYSIHPSLARAPFLPIPQQRKKGSTT